MFPARLLIFKAHSWRSFVTERSYIKRSDDSAYLNGQFGMRRHQNCIGRLLWLTPEASKPFRLYKLVLTGATKLHHQMTVLAQPLPEMGVDTV